MYDKCVNYVWLYIPLYWYNKGEIIDNIAKNLNMSY